MINLKWGGKVKGYKETNPALSRVVFAHLPKVDEYRIPTIEWFVDKVKWSLGDENNYTLAFDTNKQVNSYIRIRSKLEKRKEAINKAIIEHYYSPLGKGCREARDEFYI